MLQVKQYSSIEEVLSYFMNLLPEPKPDTIASVSKYAKVDNERVTVKAIKQKVCLGFTWSFEIIVG
ncbi:MAG: hypothetical protein H7Y13_10980 [Sphingobacteriaceae bacterium]|nr:hypothetical protein [Sphingobacteriaceae bacterium]